MDGRLSPTDILLSFCDVSVCKGLSTPPALTDVSGYAARGCVTAVIGISQNTHILVRLLAGRPLPMHVSGSITVQGVSFHGDGAVEHARRAGASCRIAMEEDHLVSVLTVRETFATALSLRSGLPAPVQRAEVDALIHALGLTHVADHHIGSALRRGLSGGERRLVRCGVELINKPDILIIDEPTSGLDAATALRFMTFLSKLARASHIAVLVSLQQPSKSLLSTIDLFAILDRPGRLCFFGALDSAIAHFHSLGYPLPARSNPADHLLSVISTHGSSASFPEAFRESLHGADMRRLIHDSRRAFTDPEDILVMGEDEREELAGRLGEGAALLASTPSRAASLDAAPLLTEDAGACTAHASVWQEFCTHLRRAMIIGRRDPSMYLTLVITLCFHYTFAGTLYLQLQPFRTNGEVIFPFIALGILVVLSGNTQIFRSYYNLAAKERFLHERRNGVARLLPYFSAELTATSLWMLVALPPLAIAFFMMGFPAAAFPFVLLISYLSAWVNEALIELFCALFRSTTAIIIVVQFWLIVFSTFEPVSFIPDPAQIPAGWRWLQKLSLFYHSTYAMARSVFSHSAFHCPPERINATDRSCVPEAEGIVLPCDAAFSSDGGSSSSGAGAAGDAECAVRGTTVMREFRGMEDINMWESLLYLFLLGLVFRVLVLALHAYPLDELSAWLLRRTPLAAVRDRLAEVRIRIARVQEENEHLRAKLAQADPLVRAAVFVQRSWRKRREARALLRHASVHGTEDFVGKSSAGSANEVDVGPRTLMLSWAGLSVALAQQKAGGEDRGSAASGNNSKASAKREILAPCSGSAIGGRVLCVMGHSGSGKTTFLNAISGHAEYASVSGTITLNGSAVRREDIYYVPQFDQLNDIFTVEETLRNMSRLKGGARDPVAREVRIRRLLSILGLSQAAHTRVRDLNSGQRKRVNLGVGLVSNSSVLLVDEPSTGVDSVTTHTMMRYIAKAARALGVVVIVTIHNPSAEVFALMDDLMLLRRGEVVYAGVLEHAHAYFAERGYVCPASENPADFYIRVLCDTSGGRGSADPTVPFASSSSLPGLGPSSPATTASSSPPSSSLAWGVFFRESREAAQAAALASRAPKRPPRAVASARRHAELHRFAVLVSRGIVENVRNPHYVWRWAQLLLLALFLGSLFPRLALSADNIRLFWGLTNLELWCILFVVTTSAPTMCTSFTITLQEYSNGAYGILTHTAAQFATSAPFNLVSALVFEGVFHWLVGMHDTVESFVYVVVMAFLLMMAVETLVHIAAELFRDGAVTASMAATIVGSLQVFSWCKAAPSFVAWLVWLDPARYALEGMALNTFRGQMYVSSIGSGDVDGDSIPRALLLYESSADKWAYIGAVAAFLVVYVVSYLFIRTRWTMRVNISAAAIVKAPFDGDDMSGVDETSRKESGAPSSDQDSADGSDALANRESIV